MKPAIPLLSLLAGACFLSGCGKPHATAGEPRPVVVKTRAGDEMILIPGGSFDMGSTKAAGEAPVHRVRVSAFLMDRFEVAQAQYARAQIPDPSHFKNPNNPVDQANWTDAARFCNERSRAEGLKPCYDETTWTCDFEADGYRLPTEAEWEFACRSGAGTQYSFGDDPRALGAHAWLDSNSGNHTHPVGQKQPNRWGLHDMHGNVAEWCNDTFEAAYYKSSPDRDPRGPATAGPEKAVRGGSWKSNAPSCRAAARRGDRSVLDTCLASDTLGFRCVRKAPPRESAAPSAAGN